MYLPLCVGVLCLYIRFVIHYYKYVHSSFAIILKRKRKLIVVLMSCYYKFSVAQPHGAMGWSAVCDCGIS